MAVKSRILGLLILMSSLTSLVACGKFETLTTIQLESVEVVDLQEPAGEVVIEEKVPTKSEASQETSKETEGPGVLRPTIYYFATITEDQTSCPETSKKDLHGAGGVSLLKVCPRTEAICGEQGSCRVIQGEKSEVLNIIGRFNGQDRYFKIPKDGCQFGYGVRSSCLDPFYTVAADLKIYQPGEVIFIPAVVGLDLPDGSKHSGYFVVRDKGRGIEGLGRFDFFTGYFHWRDSKNPFYKLGLRDQTTNIPYFRIRGEAAKAVLASRAYPKLPQVVQNP